MVLRSAERDSIFEVGEVFVMIYLVYKMHLSEKSRRNMKEFWRWLEDREKWFYQELPMVKGVRWYYSVIGDSYTI